MGRNETDPILERIIQLSHEMIALADAGDQVRSEPGCGAVFGKLRDEGYALRMLASRELQVHRLSMRQPAGATASHAVPRGTVLLVDDEPDILRYLAAWYADSGFRILTAPNGFEAIDLARQHKPSLISLDMSMPEKSGVSTYRELKSDPELRHIPVIVVTALGRAFEEFLHRRRGVPDPEGFLCKPIDLEVLSVTVQEIMNRSVSAG